MLKQEICRSRRFSKAVGHFEAYEITFWNKEKKKKKKNKVQR